MDLSQILEIDEVGQVLANQFTLYMTWYLTDRRQIGLVDFKLRLFRWTAFQCLLNSLNVPKTSFQV